MRIIKILFFSLLALSLIFSTGIFIFFETFNTDQYLPQITRKASLILGRPVSIGQVGMGLSSRGITLDAGPVVIADDAFFTSQPFMTVDRVRVSLDLMPLVLRREIRIKNILLESPQIHFIRSQEGNINVRSIGHTGSSAGDGSGDIASPDDSGQRPVSSSAMAIPSQGVNMSDASTGDLGKETASAFLETKQSLINSITIRDASISYIDQNQSMPLDIWLTNVNAGMDDLSWDPSSRSVKISGMQLNADMSRLDIKEISPEISADYLIRNIAGIAQLNLAHLEIGASGDLTASGDIIVSNGVIKNFNIIKTVLSHTLGSFGGIDGNIDNLLNGPLKNTLGRDDTMLEKVSVQFSIHDKAVFIDNSLIKTNIFELTAQGSMDQGLNLDMQTMLHLNEDVSAALINRLDALKYLTDDSQRIAIGASLKGVIPHLKYKPNKDFRKKSKKALMQEGGNILGVLLGGG